MKNVSCEILFVSNSELFPKDIEKLELLTDDILIRKNIGYDFSAVRDAFFYLGWDTVKLFDSVIIMNDTCFGPFFDLSCYFKKMKEVECDFWGITDHPYRQDGMPVSNSSIPYHIQSYFVVYKNKILRSIAFQSFWNNVNDYENVCDVIIHYETQLTELLNSLNFKSCAIFPYENIGLIDFMFWNVDVAIKEKVPFVKIKGLLNCKKRWKIIILLMINYRYSIVFVLEYLAKNIYNCKIFFNFFASMKAGKK